MQRTTISLSEEDFEKIKEYCKAKDMKISSLLRLGAKKIINKKDGQIG